MRTEPNPAEFVPLRDASRALGVPMTFLRREALRGTIPCLRASRRMLFNVASTREALLRQTEPGGLSA